ncbi:MAG: hypothetical protein EP343_24245 [Deltaproteobacteria bacterium]|nr:MAG: hypothetical protein EP343_24245 [Deltaproteobacteria bacterium]
MAQPSGSSSLQTALLPYTSLLRPPDLRRLWHKVALLLVVASGVIAVVLSVRNKDTTSETALAGLLGVLGVYGAWALVRELLVDDDVTPLLGAGLALWVVVVGRDLSLYMLYATLFSVRMVQRSVGPRATLVDSAVIVGLTMAGMVTNLNMLFWFAAVVAFVLDASLRERAWRQLVFAAGCIGGGVYFDLQHKYMMRELGFVTLPSWGKWLFVLALFCFLASFFVRCAGAPTEDGTHIRTHGRFRASMVVVLACAITSLFAGYIGLLNVGLVWVALPAVGLGLLVRLVRQWTGNVEAS